MGTHDEYPPSADGNLIARETAVAAHVETVGVRELRQNLSVYLDEVKRGRSLVVTERGQRVALLKPLPASLSALDRLVMEGKATPPRRGIRAIGSALESPAGEPSLSDALQAMRDEDVW